MTDQPTDDIEELAEALGQPAPNTVDIGGDHPVEVYPLKAGKLPAFARALRPLLPVLAPLLDQGEDGGVTPDDLVAAMGEHGDHLLDAVAIGAGLGRDAVDELDLDQLIELAMTVIRVNLDFFTRRLAPTLTSQASKLTQATQEQAGTTPPSA